MKRRSSLKRNNSVKKLVKAVRRLSSKGKIKSDSSKHGGEEEAVVVKNIVTQDKVINEAVKTLTSATKLSTDDRSPSFGSNEEDVPSVSMTASMSFDDEAVDDFPLESPSPTRIGCKISSSALGSSTPSSLRPVEEDLEAAPEPIVPWVPSMESDAAEEDIIEDEAIIEDDLENVAVYPEVVEALKKVVEEVKELRMEEVKEVKRVEVEDAVPTKEVTFNKSIEEIIAPIAMDDVKIESLPRGLFVEASCMLAVVAGIAFWNQNAFELLGYTS